MILLEMDYDKPKFWIEKYCLILFLLNVCKIYICMGVSSHKNALISFFCILPVLFRAANYQEYKFLYISPKNYVILWFHESGKLLNSNTSTIYQLILLTLHRYPERVYYALESKKKSKHTTKSTRSSSFWIC